MSRTITALFDTRADADAGAERLRQAGVDAAHVAVHDDTTHQTSGADPTTRDQGLWASIKGAFVPHEDRHAYEEGIRRGGFLLTATVDDDNVPEAVAALEDANSIDLDERSRQWRAQGWDAAPVAEADENLLTGSRDAAVGGARFRSYTADRG
ncbi:hypothetical protein [Sphingomonas bacterium]|uniref:hypothetical protein n=1 Tax=Sphingomonas bacterium TaxID=1895847 RepID=UPI001575EE2A|nr:hypothetical protein [Sphingomonas bacterium]